MTTNEACHSQIKCTSGDQALTEDEKLPSLTLVLSLHKHDDPGIK